MMGGKVGAHSCIAKQMVGFLMHTGGRTTTHGELRPSPERFVLSVRLQGKLLVSSMKPNFAGGFIESTGGPGRMDTHMAFYRENRMGYFMMIDLKGGNTEHEFRLGYLGLYGLDEPSGGHLQGSGEFMMRGVCSRI